MFYYLVSSMMVQVLTFLAFAPSKAVVAHTGGFAGFRAIVGGQPWIVQFIEIMVLTDLAQYWFHRAFHRVPFLWGFHAVHHSAKSMDWLAGARMHFFEIVALRGVTALPMMTLGFLPSALQAYIAVVYIYSSLIHANLRGNFERLGKWLVVPRFHHWHHGLEEEAIDVNFAIHFPWIDRLFGTYHFPKGRWSEGYGVPEAVPTGYRAQFAYPFRRHKLIKAKQRTPLTEAIDLLVDRHDPKRRFQLERAAAHHLDGSGGLHRHVHRPLPRLVQRRSCAILGIAEREPGALRVAQP